MYIHCVSLDPGRPVCIGAFVFLRAFKSVGRQCWLCRRGLPHTLPSFFFPRLTVLRAFLLRTAGGAESVPIFLMHCAPGFHFGSSANAGLSRTRIAAAQQKQKQRSVAYSITLRGPTRPYLHTSRRTRHLRPQRRVGSPPLRRGAHLGENTVPDGASQLLQKGV